MTFLALCALLGLGTVLLAAPGRRFASDPQGQGAGARSENLAGRRGARRARRGRRRGPDIGALAAEVSARLGAGARVENAWSDALARAGLGEGPAALDPSGVPQRLLDLADSLARRRGGYPRRVRAELTGAVPGLIAACRLTFATGAPLAQVLDRSAEGVAEAGRAAAARDIALAGPRATARMLGWLPGLGLLLCVAVGVNPLRVLGDGSWGSAGGVLGVVLAGIGWWWVSRLERQAERWRP